MDSSLQFNSFVTTGVKLSQSSVMKIYTTDSEDKDCFSIVELKDNEDNGIEYYGAFTYDLIQMFEKGLMGEILTIIDASISNEKQLKAIKDLIRARFANHYSSLFDIVHPSYEPSEEDLLNAKPVSLEEALGA